MPSRRSRNPLLRPPAGSFVARGLDAQHALEREFADAREPDVLVRGSGTAVVFVPTFAELNFVYMPLRDALSPTFRTVLYIPDVSASRPFGATERARELANVLDRIGTQQAHLVGWSDAGCVVSQFAADYPDRVINRAYVGTANRYVLPIWLRALGDVYARSPMFRVTPSPVAAFLIALLMGSPDVPTRHLYPEIRRLGPVAGYMKFSVLSCLRYQGAHPVGPALVVGGTVDRFVRPDHMRALADTLNTEYVEIPGADHFLAWTAPDAVTAAVTAFLRP